MVTRRREITLPRDAETAEHVFFCDAVVTIGVGVSRGMRKVSNVLCAIHPRDSTPPRTVYLFPSVRQAKQFEDSQLFSLSGRYDNGNAKCYVEAKEIWCHGVSTWHWRNFLGYSGLSGQPTVLNTTSVLEGSSTSKFIERGSFYLSEIPVANTSAMILRSFTGSTRVRQLKKPTFTLQSGIKLFFTRHYSHKPLDGVTTTQSEMTAEFIAIRPIRSLDFEKVEADVEGFLILTSLAARYRCQHHGWEYSAGGTLARREYFNRIKPSQNIPDGSATLISRSEFPKFIRHGYRIYHKLMNRELLDRAIHSLIGDRAFLEDRFLSLFAGLQSILWLSYRNSGAVGRRVPIKKLYAFFEQNVGLETKDLWPLFDDTEGVTLYTIRNAIVHGEYLAPERMLAVAYATDHLSWLLERMILKVVNWPLDRTNIEPKRLRNWMSASEWRNERKNW